MKNSMIFLPNNCGNSYEKASSSHTIHLIMIPNTIFNWVIVESRDAPTVSRVLPDKYAYTYSSYTIEEGFNYKRGMVQLQ
jgi:hypothetical protein